MGTLDFPYKHSIHSSEDGFVSSRAQCLVKEWTVSSGTREAKIEGSASSVDDLAVERRAREIDSQLELALGRCEYDPEGHESNDGA